MSDNNSNNYLSVNESCSLCGRTFLKPEPCICQIIDDLKSRIKQHNLGNGAKYTRGRGPVKLVYSEQCADRSTALKREAEIKKLTRSQKKNLL